MFEWLLAVFLIAVTIIIMFSAFAFGAALALRIIRFFDKES